MSSLAVGLVTDRNYAALSRQRTWSFLAFAAVLIALAVSVKVALGATHPSFPYDEVDQLQMSRLLAGLETPDVRGAGYFPAWAFVIAPVWWFTTDPAMVYSISIWLGLLVGLTAIVPLTYIAKRFRLATNEAIVASSIVLTTPAIAIQTDFALSERLLFLSTSIVLLTAWRLWERPTIVRAVVFGLALGLMYFTHVRMAVILLAAAIWLILFALHNWRIALVALGTLAIVYFVVHELSVGLNIRLIGGFDQGSGLFDTLKSTRFGLLARSSSGQAWTQVVGTLGLAAIGAAGVAVLAWREIRHLRVGKASFLFAIVLAAYLLSTVKWASDWHLFANPWVRIDTWLYGRYIDPLSALFVLAGAAFLIRAIRTRVLLTAAIASFVVLLIGTFGVAIQAPSWGYLTPAHVPGITPWASMLPDVPFGRGTSHVPTPWNANRFWFWASACSILAFTVYFVFRRRPVALASFLIAAFAIMSVVGDEASNDFHKLEGDVPPAIAPLQHAISESQSIRIAFDKGCSGNGAADSVRLNYYGYWLLPGILRTYDSSKGPAPEDADLLITCGADQPHDAPNSVIIPGTTFKGATVWVRDPSLQELLRNEGVLE